MVLKIRKGFFETNSSSLHAYSVKNDGEIKKPSIIEYKDGKKFFICELGEWGRGSDIYKYSSTKISYCVYNLLFSNQIERLNYILNFLIKELNVDYIIYTNDSHGDGKYLDQNGNEWKNEYFIENALYPLEEMFNMDGFIDHQSINSGMFLDLTDEELFNYFFNENSLLIIDSDESNVYVE